MPGRAPPGCGEWSPVHDWQTTPGETFPLRILCPLCGVGGAASCGSGDETRPRPCDGGLTRRSEEAIRSDRWRVDRRDGARALVGVRPEHDQDLVHVLSDADAGRRADRACWGAATLLSSHAEHPDRRRATQQKGSQANPGRQPQRESARRPVGTFSSASDVTDHRIETASLNATAPYALVAPLVALSDSSEAVLLRAVGAAARHPNPGQVMMSRRSPGSPPPSGSHRAAVRSSAANAGSTERRPS